MNRLDALLLLALLLPTAIVTILHPLLCPGMRLLICDACQFVILNLFQLVPEDAVHLLPKLTIGCSTFRAQLLYLPLEFVDFPTRRSRDLLKVHKMRRVHLRLLLLHMSELVNF